MGLVKSLGSQPQTRPSTRLKPQISIPGTHLETVNPCGLLFSLKLSRDFLSCSSLRYKTCQLSSTPVSSPSQQAPLWEKPPLSHIFMAPSEPLPWALIVIEVEMVTVQTGRCMRDQEPGTTCIHRQVFWVPHVAHPEASLTSASVWVIRASVPYQAPAK